MSINRKWYPTIENMKLIWSALGWLQKQVESGGTPGSGTVTSVGMSVPTGLTITGSPITTAGTLALTYTSGYSIPTTASQANWNTAFGWGNHAGLYPLLNGTGATGTWSIGISGNAATATVLQTARTINGTSFNGSSDITVTAAAGTLTGNTLAAGVTASSLTSVGTLANLTVTNPINGTVTNGVVTTGSYANPSWITSLAYSKLTGAPDLSLYVPYDGATNDLNLNTASILDAGNITSTGAVTGASFVKSGGTASQFLKADGTVDSTIYAPLSTTINTKTADYTLVLGDAGEVILMNLVGANNLTVPPNSSVAFPIGTQIIVSQENTGQTTIVAGSGVTIHSADGYLKTRVQYSTVTLIKKATDVWLLSGDLTA